MLERPAKTLRDLVKHVDRYPEEAFLFVREGLQHATEHVHGRETEAHRHLYQFLAANELDWSDLVAQYYAGTLPEPLVQAVDAAGGCEQLNRHVSGRELCWGLRDFALKRWGLLARIVLRSWSITSTTDFGRIVFGFIEFDLMQKQSDDRIEDFHDVFSFVEAFDDTYQIPENDADREDGTEENGAEENGAEE